MDDDDSQSEPLILGRSIDNGVGVRRRGGGAVGQRVVPEETRLLLSLRNLFFHPIRLTQPALRPSHTR